MSNESRTTTDSTTFQSPVIAEFMAPSTLIAAPHQTVAQAIEVVRGTHDAQNSHVAVCVEGRLTGLIGMAALFRAEPETTLAQLAQPPAVVVDSETSAERAAWIASHQEAEAVAVVDDAGRFIGLVPVYRLTGLLVHEHEVDLARMGGFMRGSIRARTASEEPVLRRVWHRAPWLLVGLLGAVVAAQIVSSFEAELEGQLALAFFLPGIVYMADAVGTQTETLVIRGLSIDVPVSRIFRLEILTGAVVGIILSISILPFAFVITDNTHVSAVVAISLFAATSIASMVAMTLPWFISRLNFDPAFGSGPLATVVQDLLSILIYFAVAMALLG